MDLWVKEEKIGISKLTGGNSTEVLEGTSVFKDIAVYAILKLEGEKYLIFTSEDGLFFYEKNKIKPVKSPINELLKDTKIYHAIELSNGNIAIATLRDGLIVINSDFKLIHFTFPLLAMIVGR